MKVTECVVFVPATPGSKLRDILQRKDDELSEMLGIPGLKFVEKGGRMILDRIGLNDPWKTETFCQRTDCLHCQRRLTLAQEQEEKAMTKITGEQTDFNPPKGMSSLLPGCTQEGITYTCRGPAGSAH